MNLSKTNLLGGLSSQEFLEKYWQKRPLLIRKAFPQWQLPFDGQDLAGLSLEEGTHSRIVIQHKRPKEKQKAWEVKYGPFSEEDFSKLPVDHWTLLVQETDHWIPEMAALKEYFRFLPDWRIDDVMISYATDQGSVGPHTDEYDVFLLQGQGRRKWFIETSPRCDDGKKKEWIPGLDLKILSSFHPDESYVLEPGDMLYLPPRVAHHGVALGECMTLSIGLRAPSLLEIVGGYLEDAHAFEGGNFDRIRYQDPDLVSGQYPAEIHGVAIDKTIKLLSTLPLERKRIERFLGKFVTSPKRTSANGTWPGSMGSTLKHLKELLRNSHQLVRQGEARLAFIRLPQGGLRFFAQGREFQIPKKWTPIIEKLTSERSLKLSELGALIRDDKFLRLLNFLINVNAFSLEKKSFSFPQFLK